MTSNSHEEKRRECVGALLLAGGLGIRMQSALPKQYLLLEGRPMARYSFEVFMNHPEIQEVVVVCEERYQSIFSWQGTQKRVSFAPPGRRRQDSVRNGLSRLTGEIDLVVTHDAARPLLEEAWVSRVLEAGREWGCATLAVPLAFTVKQSDAQGFVSRTLDRSNLWEIQTPQVLRLEDYKSGLEQAEKEGLTVSDCCALLENLHRPVKLVPGSRENLKITTPEDLSLAQAILEQRQKAGGCELR